jgi:hypothetical protein
MVWWQWILVILGIKKIFRNREVRKLLKKALDSALYFIEAALRTPYIDFKWDVEKYQAGFNKLDIFRIDKRFTDEELGEVIGEFGEVMPMGLRRAFYVAEGILKSRMVNFEWNVEKYKPVFNQLNDMRLDNYLEDEEFADFIAEVRKALKKE